MTGAKRPYSTESSLGIVVERLNFSGLSGSRKYLLGGSCGQWLQHVVLGNPPSDIDLYCDREDLDELHEALCGFAEHLDGPTADNSGNCFSWRGRYMLGGVPVELISGYQIGFGSGYYDVNIRRLLHNAPLGEVKGGGRLGLIPLAHEWVCYTLRGREERCRRIVAAMREDWDAHLPLLRELVLQGQLYEALERNLEALTGSLEWMETG